MWRGVNKGKLSICGHRGWKNQGKDRQNLNSCTQQQCPWIFCSLLDKQCQCELGAISSEFFQYLAAHLQEKHKDQHLQQQLLIAAPSHWINPTPVFPGRKAWTKPLLPLWLLNCCPVISQFAKTLLKVLHSSSERPHRGVSIPKLRTALFPTPSLKCKVHFQLSNTFMTGLVPSLSQTPKKDLKLPLDQAV